MGTTGQLRHRRQPDSSHPGPPPQVSQWAYARTYLSNDERLSTLSDWVNHYNRDRPHTGIGNIPPTQAVNNLTGNYS
jgi:transposase InsO family protein